MRHLLPIAVALLFTGFAITPALSADDQDRVTCFSLGSESYKDKDNFDSGMSACTRMINSGVYKDKGLASIYRARGSWKQKKGDLDSSLADYGISIGIEPNNVESYD